MRKDVKVGFGVAGSLFAGMLLLMCLNEEKPAPVKHDLQPPKVEVPNTPTVFKSLKDRALEEAPEWKPAHIAAKPVIVPAQPEHSVDLPVPPVPNDELLKGLERRQHEMMEVNARAKARAAVVDKIIRDAETGKISREEALRREDALEEVMTANQLKVAEERDRELDEVLHAMRRGEITPQQATLQATKIMEGVYTKRPLDAPAAPK